MSTEQPLIDQLKDIHLPASGTGALQFIQAWWIIALLAAVAVLALVLYRRHQKKIRPRIYALNELEQMRQRYQQHKEDQRLLNEINVLLRRMAILYYDREEVASLSGEAWLQFLDKSGQTKDFSSGPGQILSHIYDDKKPEFDEPVLSETVRLWISQQA